MFTAFTHVPRRLGINLLDGFRLAAGDTFDLLTSKGLLSGGFDGLSIDGAACSASLGDSWSCDGFDLDLSVTDGSRGSVDLIVAAASGPNPVAVVPEPSTWAMLPAGFLALGGLALRRRASGA